MRNGIWIGLAIGAILGAVFVEGSAPASEIVTKSKKAIKKNATALADNISDRISGKKHEA